MATRFMTEDANNYYLAMCPDDGPCPGVGAGHEHLQRTYGKDPGDGPGAQPMTAARVVQEFDLLWKAQRPSVSAPVVGYDGQTVR